MNEFEYKGLILKQNTYNWHYMIFDKETNEMLMHCSCTKKLNKSEMKQAIDRLFLIKEHITNDIIYGKNREEPKGLLDELLKKEGE